MTKLRGSKAHPWGTPLLRAVQSEGTPFTMTLSLLPANQFSIQAATLEALDAQGSKLPLEPFVMEFIEGLAEVQKDYISPPNGHTHRTRSSKSQGRL